ncbi:peptidoglycan recognition protein family protein [Micromonospora inyonensis]|uniref:N-acetylmuramoyl-L-alanine amidase n=1 Tax=Micromonospora inyonensis TaxID=47866 RepID=A0A1C6S9R3_9ACTN|nr:peptidoglycan recognition family protein [Micromonospora inyonensis]SCL26237.1 SH3 domain-containing protein [Micromonospora inyonensis]
MRLRRWASMSLALVVLQSAVLGAAPAAHAAVPAPSADAGSDPSVLSTDYGLAAWVPASTSNYTVATRPTGQPITHVVIHVTQGSYAGAISWFQNPASKVSAHYTFRSSDGAVTQSVREKDIAWHAGNWTYNTQSIGIEHEAWVDNPAWYTDAMYRASAALTRNLANKYGIPKTRSNIIAHSEVPGATHTDPGPYWNWTYYMQLVNGVTGIGSGTVHSATPVLNVRSGPGTGYAVVGTLTGGTTVSVYCQATGTSVTGPYGTTGIWHRIGTNRYVSAAYLNTGYSGYIPNVPRC